MRTVCFLFGFNKHIWLWKNFKSFRIVIFRWKLSTIHEFISCTKLKNSVNSALNDRAREHKAAAKLCKLVDFFNSQTLPLPIFMREKSSTENYARAKCLPKNCLFCLCFMKSNIYRTNITTHVLHRPQQQNRKKLFARKEKLAFVFWAS